MRFEVKEGHEIRGFRIRLYPDKETEAKLDVLAQDLRYAWNWLVNNVGGQKCTAHQASETHAVREGLVPRKPAVPSYDGMEPDQAHEAKLKFRSACGDWYRSVRLVTKSTSGCQPLKLKEWMEHFGCKQDYQLMTKVIGWKYEELSAERVIKPGAHLLQALVKNYYTRATGQRPKKFRRSRDAMPIQVRSKHCFAEGSFGERRGAPFYNCQVSINGLKIRGRLPGMRPTGRVLEGVSLIKEADGWWASIKQEVPVRELPRAVPGTVVGIDVGLDNIVAFDDGTRVQNVRTGAFSAWLASLQKAGKPTGRLQQRYARHVRHVIYNQILKPLARVETIKIESLDADLGQRGSRSVSVMKTVHSHLKGRYGTRVREVLAAYTSQRCSKCGLIDKESWSYEGGPIGKCCGCGFSQHRDVNAARNIAASEPLAQN